MNQEKSKLMQEALKSAPIGILLLDENNQIQWHNETLEKILGITPEQLSIQSTDELSDELKSVLISPPETIFLQQGEKQRWLSCRTEAREGRGSVRFYVDISSEQQLKLERDRLAEDLQQLTTRDPITGLPNRRALLQGLEPLVSRSRRYGNPLSVIKMNLDLISSDGAAAESKQEEAWTRVGQLLKDQMRWADIIGRYDGSDFLLILPETPENTARQLASKLCDLISQINVNDKDGHSIQVKPFCGITGWDKGDDSTLMLKRAADKVSAARQAGTPIASVN